MLKITLTRERLFGAAGYLAWLGGLLWLLVSRGYTSFLAPGFASLLAISAAALGLFAMATITRPPAPNVARPDGRVRWAIALLPLGFLLLVPWADAGSHTFDQRGGMGRAVPPGMVLAASPSESAQPTTAADGAVQNPVQKGPPMAVTLIDLYRDFNTLVGRRVSVIGMVNPRSGLPKDTVVLFRFVMSCCAADAQPVGVMVRCEGAASLRRDTWVRVEGVLERGQVDGEAVPTIRAEKIVKIVRPSQPYLN